MDSSVAACNVIFVVLLSYLLHSTIAVVLTELILNRLKCVCHPELRVLAWKLAFCLPIGSSLAVTTLDLPHFGFEVPISMLGSASSLSSKAVGLKSGQGADGPVADLGPTASTLQSPEADAGRLAIGDPAGPDSDEIGWQRKLDHATVGLCVLAVWFALVAYGLIRVGLQAYKLEQLRRRASPIRLTGLNQAARRLCREFGIRRRVLLLQSTQVRGPMTAGMFRPFILLPAAWSWGDATQRDALLAHELVHVARWDAFWNLAVQVLCRAFPFQPLLTFAGRQLRKEMDFVADLFAAQTSEARVGLAQSLIRLGDQLASTPRASRDSELAACMASFNSMLGRRVELLLTENVVRRPSSLPARLAVVVWMVTATMATASIGPRAVTTPSDINSPTSFARKDFMNRQLTTLAVFIGLTLPSVADEPQTNVEDSAAPKVRAAITKPTPDAVPPELSGFNGMLVGRLAAKDVEKGKFLVQIDAVSRVWKNSGARDPKAIVGKTVEVSGVFGRFLDVLVVARTGETLEFECKHDGERLVFPGELLRKVAPYDPADYPALPEGFRGFHGAVAATIVRKDPETFEMILKVDRVIDSWKGSQAKDPKTIEGKTLMLAGFWNRKEVYHDLKAGDKIEVGMQHIESRSDHLTLAEFARKAGGGQPQQTREVSSQDEASKGVRGFRGMLVGRLVEKDIERGTFTITVDAVPRVWKNNAASNPKSLLGSQVKAEGVTGKMLDALIVAKTGDTIEFGALNSDGDRLRVGEVLRKVAPVKPGDYPVLPDEFRGFRGFILAKVLRKDDHLLELIVEIKAIKSALPASRAERPESAVGQHAMLSGFWQRKDVFHEIGVGDTIECGVEHPQYLSDHLSVIESVKKVGMK